MKTTQEMIEEAVDRFSPIIYEPEHEEGVTCWCKPIATVEGLVTHITHNPERDKLTKIFEKELTTLATEVENAVLERVTKEIKKRGLHLGYKNDILDFLSTADHLRDSKTKEE